MARTTGWFGSITLMVVTPQSRHIRAFSLSWWRMGHKLLPTDEKISSIRQNVSRDCPRLLNKDYSCCIDWIEDAMRLLNKKAIAYFITTAKMLSQDFQIHNMVNKPMLPLTPILKKLEKPLSNTVNINFDATVSNDKTGFGVIVHDSDGFVIGRGYGFKDEQMTTAWTELYAFEESLKIARSLNIANAILEIDCASLRTRLRSVGRILQLWATALMNILKPWIS
ncbi:hypothetical protein Gotri_012581 [Gossypium trilobum]|uniref:RNase H type-1 domain-containing protein n=1 Tax=Gossypium trilobum TaxID=34281 RepID=A0A7J9DQY8_9ROSI|nr:hypothetical protein [Gossypium trilobum]